MDNDDWNENETCPFMKGESGSLRHINQDERHKKSEVKIQPEFGFAFN
jgi:hypothetical protein